MNVDSVDCRSFYVFAKRGAPRPYFFASTVTVPSCYINSWLMCQATCTDYKYCSNANNSEKLAASKKALKNVTYILINLYDRRYF
jgi:hypothetical protein